MCVGSL